MTDRYHVFLSYSRNDLDAAGNLRAQLEGFGLSTFKDDASIREGDLWLDRLQEAVDGCGSFVMLVGRDGVRRWIGAETQAALSRYFGPHDEAKRLPIFPVLLGETTPEMLPAFLRLFQATRWNGTDALPPRLLEQIRERNILRDEAARFEGCPFVGLAAFQLDEAHLFFGREKEILDALACFDTRRGDRLVRWLEINGNSGSGKSSLMNAGLLPLVDQGWLWPRTGYERWRRIGPMLPGAHPVEMLAEHLARTFNAKMKEVLKDLQDGDASLRYWLRERKEEETAFLLAIDQFEELFTFAEPDERARFDRLVASALEDADCPLFLLSTVRADFLDRFEALPRLVSVRNRRARPWTLPLMGPNGLRAVIDGPARLAVLDVSEVREAMVAEARDEPGALPLVENALHWLWEPKRRQGDRLSGQLLTQQGGLAGILSQSADDLLRGVDRDRALELLFQLVNVDPEGVRHTRRRILLHEALDIAGGGEPGRKLVDHLAGTRARDGRNYQGPLRLITVTAEGLGPDQRDWVSLIHETLIRRKSVDADGKPQGYWPTLWDYIEAHKTQAVRRERLQSLAGEWKDRTGLARFLGLAGWSGVFRFRGLAAPGSIEERYLAWSRRMVGAQLGLLGLGALIVGVLVESAWWANENNLPPSYILRRPLWLLGYKEVPGMVEIKPGKFTMGCLPGRDVLEERKACSDFGEPKPPLEVTISDAFKIGEKEVTFLEYDYYVWDQWRNGIRVSPPKDEGWGRHHQPVINVSFLDAKAYMNWLSTKTGKLCRLPKEAEWEYAARAGTETAYWWGGTFDKTKANCEGSGPKPVGSFGRNPWGLYDTSGNVYEWVNDRGIRSDVAPSGPTTLPQETPGDPAEFHSPVGSQWGSPSWLCTADVRPVYTGDNRSVGFRVLCSND